MPRRRCANLSPSEGDRCGIAVLKMSLAVAQEKTPDKVPAKDDKSPDSDELKRAEKDVQDVTNGHVAKIDEVLAHKEKEVMEV